MTATVHHIRPVEPDPLDELRDERAKIDAELQRFVVVDERRIAAEAKIAEIDAALAAIDRADQEAVERWAETAEGEPPAPLLDERKALMARRLDAEAERRGAEIAVAAVAAKRTALIGDMNRIGVRIRERQVGVVLDEGRRVHGEAEALAADLAGKLQRLMGLRQAIVGMMNEASSKGDTEQGRVLGAGLSQIDAMRRPEVFADPATVERFAREWREALR